MKNNREGATQLRDAVPQRLAAYIHLLDSMGKDCLVTLRDFGVSPLSNPFCWMWLLLKKETQGTNAFLSMSQLF